MKKGIIVCIRGGHGKITAKDKKILANYCGILIVKARN